MERLEQSGNQSGDGTYLYTYEGLRQLEKIVLNAKDEYGGYCALSRLIKAKFGRRAMSEPTLRRMTKISSPEVGEITIGNQLARIPFIVPFTPYTQEQILKAIAGEIVLIEDEEEVDGLRPANFRHRDEKPVSYRDQVSQADSRSINELPNHPFSQRIIASEKKGAYRMQEDSKEARRLMALARIIYLINSRIAVLEKQFPGQGRSRFLSAAAMTDAQLNDLFLGRSSPDIFVAVETAAALGISIEEYVGILKEAFMFEEEQDQEPQENYDLECGDDCTHHHFH